MAIVDNQLVTLFRNRIVKSCNALDEDNEAGEVIRHCTSIINSAKALQKMATEEIRDEPNNT